MDFMMSAKCGVLDRMVAGTVSLPLMPVAIAVTAFALAHVVGRVLGHVMGIQRLNFGVNWRAVRMVSGLLAVAIAILVVWRGVAYPFFVLRMIKDTYQCSYFEAGRDLQTVQIIMFALTFAVQTLCVAGLNGQWLRALPSVVGRALCYFLYIVLAMSMYSLALMVDPVLAPLAALFALPFAYCGLGMLARQR